MTLETIAHLESNALIEAADILASESIPVFIDRDASGECQFIVCADTPQAREIIEDESVGHYEVRGGSLIVTATHPAREFLEAWN